MKRSKQNLSHYRLTTGDMGYLIPVACLEVLPGDSFRHSTSVMLRIATLTAPLMHPVQARVHHWYVPNRLLMDNWEDFITGKDPNAVIPTLTRNTANSYLLWDAFGLPNHNGLEVNALPFRAYAKIWNEFYRDQDLQTELDINTNINMQRVCWEKDYFTSARTYPQFGNTAVSIPFASGLQAPVIGIGVNSAVSATAGGSRKDTLGTRTWAAEFNSGSTSFMLEKHATFDRPGVYADLSQSTGGGIDINDFRQAFAMQRFLEHRNRFGHRYRDYLRYLGVRSQDSRLQDPEYLGGGRQTVAFSEVLATAEGTNTAVGDMAGHGIAAMRTRPYTRFFPEHGYVLSLLSVRPKAIYAESVHRGWLRRTKDDIWQKEYEVMGPQAVTTKEIYGPHANTTDIFGYAPRHAEYREHPSQVTGEFRDSTSYNWHMARILGASPSLNASFVECTPTDRVYATTLEPELKAQCVHSIIARRLVSFQAKV